MILDDQLSVLSNGHRRRLLLALTEESPYTVPTVSSDPVETDGGGREHAIVMHHSHLPRLEDHGLIDWDERTGDVTKGSEFDAIEPLLTTLAENHSVQPAGEPPD
ncbi:DUF7344 domain-containing protein [Haladaptatus sp. NG-WS-4]